MKVVTPEPEAVDRFLREVLELPEGWKIPGLEPARPHRPAPAQPVSWETLPSRSGHDGSGGFIIGSAESRQFQILRGARPAIWSIAIGTRHLERAHQRCKERGIPCSELQLVDWNERDAIRAFFAEVGGILFEVLRVEPKA